MKVAEDIFEVVASGLEFEAHKRMRLSRLAADDQLSFLMHDERELGTAYALARSLDEAGYFSRLDWYYYNSTDGAHPNLSNLRPDIAVWSPLTKRLIYFELKRLGQGWSYNCCSKTWASSTI